jgi:hypothetical protein
MRPRLTIHFTSSLLIFRAPSNAGTNWRRESHQHGSQPFTEMGHSSPACIGGGFLAPSQCRCPARVREAGGRPRAPFPRGVGASLVKRSHGDKHERSWTRCAETVRRACASVVRELRAPGAAVTCPSGATQALGGATGVGRHQRSPSISRLYPGECQGLCRLHVCLVLWCGCRSRRAGWTIILRLTLTRTVAVAARRSSRFGTIVVFVFAGRLSRGRSRIVWVSDANVMR